MQHQRTQRRIAGQDLRQQPAAQSLDAGELRTALFVHLAVLPPECHRASVEK
ncbi:hypothetical protein GGI05_007224 [Coemansia sp. RSA 2603]|nr:hypothetical protein GGI05_007224 [Coemansia sp. RSA 2603]